MPSFTIELMMILGVRDQVTPQANSIGQLIIMLLVSKHSIGLKPMYTESVQQLTYLHPCISMEVYPPKLLPESINI